MKEYQFTFKGVTYECIGDDKDKQIRNFNHLIETRDWETMKNRIKNQMEWFTDALIKVKEDQTNSFW